MAFMHLSHFVQVSPGRLAGLPSHSHKAIVSLQQWHKTSFLAQQDKPHRRFAHCYASLAQQTDVDATPGSGALKAQVRLLSQDAVGLQQAAAVQA